MDELLNMQGKQIPAVKSGHIWNLSWQSMEKKDIWKVNVATGVMDSHI